MGYFSSKPVEQSSIDKECMMARSIYLGEKKSFNIRKSNVTLKELRITDTNILQGRISIAGQNFPIILIGRYYSNDRMSGDGKIGKEIVFFKIRRNFLTIEFPGGQEEIFILGYN